MYVRTYQQTAREAQRSATWRRRPGSRLMGQPLKTVQLPGVNAAARRRVAICRLMDQHGVQNTERAHRAAMAILWTGQLRKRLGTPPHPATIVRWRKRVSSALASCVSQNVLPAYWYVNVRPVAAGTPERDGQ
jgi:hypothetical protein